VPYDGGVYFLSAGSSRRWGAEGSLTVYSATGIELQGAATFLHASYREYANALGDYRGNNVPGIPQTSASIEMRYRSVFGSLAAVRWDGIGAYVVDDANMLRVPASGLLGVRVEQSFHFSGIDLRARVGLQNAANRKYTASAFVNPVGGAYIEPGLPRNWFMGMDMRVGM
jgi:iron complex outermembrane receptor protein